MNITEIETKVQEFINMFLVKANTESVSFGYWYEVFQIYKKSQELKLKQDMLKTLKEALLQVPVKIESSAIYEAYCEYYQELTGKKHAYYETYYDDSYKSSR